MPRRTDFDAVCHGKQSHPDRSAARRAANRTRADNKNLRGRLVPYVCPFAPDGEPHFHIGHESPAVAKRRNPRARTRYAS